MGVVSEAATTVAENTLASKPLKIKLLTKKPVIGACEHSMQLPMIKSMEKLMSTCSESINGSGCRKLTSLITCGTKRKLEGVDCVKQKRLKMDRYATSSCRLILGKLLKHRAAFLFNKPVDPVALHIPDYFDIIKKPMDLGTIKQKLDANKYRDSEEFESDVRLTFSNAMLYNPSDNFVHKHAKELMTIFEHLWKPVKAKINRQFEGMKELSSQRITDEATHDSDRKCLKNVSSLAVKLPGHCENRKQLSSRKDETAHNVGQTCLKSSSSQMDKLSVQGTNVKDPQGSVEASNKKVGMKDVKDVKPKGSTQSKICRTVKDTGREDSEILHAKPVYPVVKVKCENAKESMQGRKVPHNEMKLVEVTNSMTQLSRSDQDSCGGVSCLEEEHACTSSAATASSGGTVQDFETVLDIKLSPSRALRAAMLKSRFADTILKAQHKTLLQSGSGIESLKLQQEKERLERKQLEEKARIEAQIKAAESATRMKAESELRMRREQERIALEKMEQSVDLDDNFHVLRELEGLLGRPLFVLCKCHDGRSQAAYLWDQIEADEMRSSLEQLGLFMKAEYLAGDDDEPIEEEGEWEEGEVVF